MLLKNTEVAISISLAVKSVVDFHSFDRQKGLAVMEFNLLQKSPV